MQYAHWVGSEDLLNRNKLGMSCAIERAIRVIHPAGYDAVIVDKDASDWCFIAANR